MQTIMNEVIHIASFRYIRRKLSEKLELPEDSLGSSLRVQIIGNRIIICGGKKLIKYKSEEISVLCKDEVITVTGRQLKCMYFYEGTVEIAGEISTVGFEDR